MTSLAEELWQIGPFAVAMGIMVLSPSAEPVSPSDVVNVVAKYVDECDNPRRTCQYFEPHLHVFVARQLAIGKDAHLPYQLSQRMRRSLLRDLKLTPGQVSTLKKVARNLTVA